MQTHHKVCLFRRAVFIACVITLKPELQSRCQYWSKSKFHRSTSERTPSRACVDPAASAVYSDTFHSAPVPPVALADQTLLGNWSVVSANRNSLIYDGLAGIFSEMLVEIDNIKINNWNAEATSL